MCFGTQKYLLQADVQQSHLSFKVLLSMCGLVVLVQSVQYKITTTNLYWKNVWLVCSASCIQIFIKAFRYIWNILQKFCYLNVLKGFNQRKPIIFQNNEKTTPTTANNTKVAIEQQTNLLETGGKGFDLVLVLLLALVGLN